MTRARSLFLALLGALALPGLAAAALHCGPSFQAVYEGDVQFEHCYALDETTNTAMKDKAECWRDWLAHYTYGMTRDRVEYAVTRHYALTVASRLPTDDVLQQSAPGGGFRKNLISAPAPTSVFAPPPNTMPIAEDSGAPFDAEAARAPVLQIRAPGFECADRCERGWQSCKGSCAGRKCDACDRSHSQCMVSCFMDAGATTP